MYVCMMRIDKMKAMESLVSYILHLGKVGRVVPALSLAHPMRPTAGLLSMGRRGR